MALTTLSLAVWPALAAPPAEVPDADDKAEALARIERVVRENCLMCHSAAMIETQRLTPAQWKAEVEKMVGWGAPLPVEEQPKVAAHLASRYGPSLPNKPLVFANLNMFPSVDSMSKIEPLRGHAVRGAVLYARNCANCHGTNGQGAELGTNLVEKPALLDLKGFEQVVRDGRGRMPGFASTFQASEAREILDWLRTRSYQPVLPAAK